MGLGDVEGLGADVGVAVRLAFPAGGQGPLALADPCLGNALEESARIHHVAQVGEGRAVEVETFELFLADAEVQQTQLFAHQHLGLCAFRVGGTGNQDVIAVAQIARTGTASQAVRKHSVHPCQIQVGQQGRRGAP